MPGFVVFHWPWFQSSITWGNTTMPGTKRGLCCPHLTSLSLSVSKLTPSSLFSVFCTCSSRSYCRTDRRKGCYIPDDCHHHRLSVRPALTSQEGNEPASQTAGLRKTNANCPVPLVCIQLSSRFYLNFWNVTKNNGEFFLTWAGTE